MSSIDPGSHRQEIVERHPREPRVSSRRVVVVEELEIHPAQLIHDLSQDVGLVLVDFQEMMHEADSVAVAGPVRIDDVPNVVFDMSGVVPGRRFRVRPAGARAREHV